MTVPLALSVLCWLMPGIWYGLGTLIRSLFIPAEIRDSGWFGSSILALLAIATVIAIGVPLLMLYRVRVARILLSVFAAWFTAALVAEPTLEPLGAYVPVLVGSVLMWLPPSNRYLRKRIIHGNGAVP